MSGLDLDLAKTFRAAFSSTYGLDTKGACEKIVDEADDSFSMDDCDTLARIAGTGRGAIATPEELDELSALGYSDAFIEDVFGKNGDKLYNERIEWLKKNSKSYWYNDRNKSDMLLELASIQDSSLIALITSDDPFAVADTVRKAYFHTYGLNTKGSCEDIVEATDGYISMDDCATLARIAGTGNDAIATPEEIDELRALGYSDAFINDVFGRNGDKLYNERIEWLQENALENGCGSYTESNRGDMLLELGTIHTKSIIYTLAFTATNEDETTFIRNTALDSLVLTAADDMRFINFKCVDIEKRELPNVCAYKSHPDNDNERIFSFVSLIERACLSNNYSAIVNILLLRMSSIGASYLDTLLNSESEEATTELIRFISHANGGWGVKYAMPFFTYISNHLPNCTQEKRDQILEALNKAKTICEEWHKERAKRY